MILRSWVLYGECSQKLPLGLSGSGLSHSTSLIPQSHAGSPQVSMGTSATYCSFVIISAAWEIGRELFFSFFLFFLLFFFFLYMFFPVRG